MRTLGFLAVLISTIGSKFHKAFVLFVISFMLIFCPAAKALKGNINSHDPSTLVKDGNKYWQFTTGNGIYAAYSTDLISWTAGPQTVFPIGTWPSWINSAVPGFNGTFWAPDVIYMNSKYYLYYSVSTFGSSKSAIGVAVSNSLNNPNWQDLGMVVSSNGSSGTYNAIDPGMFKDTNGKVYMTYGSFFGGLVVVEIDPSTGKVKSGSSTVKVAGGNGASWEAPAIIKEGGYYYLFANRGACCQGVNSTYKIVAGRSTSVWGPYVDTNGVGLTNGGGTTVLSSSGRYIGPGHFGLLRENGSNFISVHYYDGWDNGNAKLDILNMGFANGWPFLTRDWIAAGQYRITNKNSGKVWDSWGCTGAIGESIAQGDWNNLVCQKWNLTPLGDGIYKISSAIGTRVVDVINCNANNGAKLNLWDWYDNNCQKFKLERAGDGSHVFTSLTGDRVVEVPGHSTAVGTQLGLWDYNGGAHQKWSIDPASLTLYADGASGKNIRKEENLASSLYVFPNPSKNGSFNVAWRKGSGEKQVEINIIDMKNNLKHKEIIVEKNEHHLETNLPSGIYVLIVKTSDKTFTNKLIIE